MKIIGSIFLVLIIAIIFLINMVIKRIRKQKVLSEKILIHLSGHSTLNINNKVLFQIRSNNTVYIYNKNNTEEEIPISELTKFKIKSESEIRRDKLLAPLVTLEAVDFGVNEKIKNEEQFFILSYLQNGSEINCVFKQTRDNQRLDDIVNILNILPLA